MAEKPDASSSPQLLDRIGRILDAQHVDWATIGALAVAYHGVVRASLDADALITLKDADLDLDFFKRAIEDEFDGLKLRVASPEDLIALKVFAGGPKDMDDAEGVLEVQESGIDRNLVLSLCKRFGRDEEIRCRKLLGL